MTNIITTHTTNTKTVGMALVYTNQAGCWCFLACFACIALALCEEIVEWPGMLVGGNLTVPKSLSVDEAADDAWTSSNGWQSFKVTIVEQIKNN